MTFTLENPPLDYVVIQVSTNPHPALAAMVPNVALKLFDLGFPNDATRTLREVNVTPQGAFANQKPIWNFVANDTKSFFSIKEGSLSLVASNYDTFSEFKSTFFNVLDSLTEELKFLKATAVSLRYINSFSVEQFPSSLISDQYQGQIWSVDSAHIHSDYHGWADTTEPSGRITIKSKMVKGHAVAMDGVAEITQLLPVKAKPKTKFSVGFDVSEHSRPLDKSHPVNASEIQSYFHSQHDRIKSLFETVLTSESKKAWGYKVK